MKSTDKKKKKERLVVTPRGYISQTQKRLWKSSPDRYIRQYFYGEEMRFPESVQRALDLGKKVADAKENKKKGKKWMTEDMVVDALVTLLPEYEIIENEVIADVTTKDGTFKVLGKMDTSTKSILKIGEYKTGRVAWTQGKVDKDPQILFYMMLGWLKTGKIAKEVHLHWAPTEYSESGELRLTGDIVTFKTTRTLLQIMEEVNDTKKVALEIHTEYLKHLGA